MPRLTTRAVILLTAAIILTPCAGVATVGTGRHSDYRIYAKGFRIGELKTTLTPVTGSGGPSLQFTSAMHIDASLLFFSVRQETREEAEISAAGTVTYHRRSKDKNGSTQVNGRLEKDGFVFDVIENGVSRSIVFPSEQYDHTTLECPEMTIGKVGETLSQRLLDVETLSIVTRTYHWVRSEDVTVNGTTIHCRVVDFEDRNKKGRRWISSDGMGVIIARQDGSGTKGSYSLRATAIAPLPNGKSGLL